MQTQDSYPSVRPFGAHALAATLAVVCLPVAVVYGLLTLVEPDPPLFAVSALGVLLALGAIVAGTALWMRQPQSTFIGFSDLMVWRWMQRRRAEKQLLEGARLLGLDRAGRPVSEVRIRPEQQLQVLKDLTTALETKDPYTHGHSQRVERHCYRTAATMGLSAADIEDVRKAAALHDVGKIRVPDRILRKEGPLSAHERAMIQEHSVVGAWMVSSVGNADVIAGVRHHHEHWDGSGYPDGLTGSDIPLFARIIAVADAYDAINSTRPYRASLGREHATGVLRGEAGRQFDPEIVEYFIAALPTRLPVAAGLLVALAGPAKLFRSLAAWFRRFGAGSLTPAIGAAGAAVVLGASIFTPNIPSGGVERNVTLAQDTQTSPVKVPGAKHKPHPRRVPKMDKRERLVATLAAVPEATVLGVRFENTQPGAHETVQGEPHSDVKPHHDPKSGPWEPTDPPPQPRPHPSQPGSDPDPEPGSGHEPEPTPEPGSGHDDEADDHDDESTGHDSGSHGHDGDGDNHDDGDYDNHSHDDGDDDDHHDDGGHEDDDGDHEDGHDDGDHDDDHHGGDGDDEGGH